MQLFHFTAQHHAASIAEHGLTLGGVVLASWFSSQQPLDVVARDPDRFVLRGWQWLTDDPRWQQPWSPRAVKSNSGHVCDRTEVRFTVRIPKSHRDRLYGWNRIAPRFGFDAESLKHFNEAGHSDGRSWFVFDGHVPPKWLLDMEVRPKVAPPHAR